MSLGPTHNLRSRLQVLRPPNQTPRLLCANLFRTEPTPSFFANVLNRLIDQLAAAVQKDRLKFNTRAWDLCISLSGGVILREQTELISNLHWQSYCHFSPTNGEQSSCREGGRERERGRERKREREREREREKGPGLNICYSSETRAHVCCLRPIFHLIEIISKSKYSRMIVG